MATAVSSQQLLGLFAGLDRTRSDLPFVPEPLFGATAPVFLLTAVANLAPSANVVATVRIPTSPALLGRALWGRAVQLAGSIVHASALVGGVVH